MKLKSNKFLLFLFFATIFYSLTIFSFYEIAIIGIGEHEKNIVKQADLHYEDIQNTRAWNAKLGSVYAYSSGYKPNPYLTNNTIKDENGKELIRINTAWMTRMLSEQSKNKDYKFYLKSNKPINPINKATGFYEKSLNEISKLEGGDDTKRFQFIKEKKQLQYIKALYLQESCMNCHNKSEDKLHSLRGGIAIEIDASSYFDRVDEIWIEFYKISALITILSLLLFYSFYKFVKRTQEIDKLNKNLIVQNGLYLNTLFDSNPNIIIVTNGGRILKTNKAFFDFFNEYNSLDTFLKEYNCICQFFYPDESNEFLTNKKNEWISDALSKEQAVARIKHNSNYFYFSVRVKRIYENTEMHYMVTFSDITQTYNLKREYERLSIVDPLTGLFNRRHFNNIMKEELNRAGRDNHSLTFLILDIDFFKLYNDNYGHDKGDVLLQNLSKELMRLLKRSNEFVFRLGGEEFGVIYSGLSKNESLAHAKSICSSIKKMKLEHEYNIPSKVLTVSMGHFYTNSLENINSNIIYHNADKALYYAKEHGRDKVADYDEVV